MRIWIDNFHDIQLQMMDSRNIQKLAFLEIVSVMLRGNSVELCLLKNG